MTKKEIWEAVELELRREKKANPSYPDHVCGQASMVAEKAGMLISDALQLKYEGDGSEEMVQQSAVKVAASAIRFLIEFKK